MENYYLNDKLLPNFNNPEDFKIRECLNGYLDMKIQDLNVDDYSNDKQNSNNLELNEIAENDYLDDFELDDNQNSNNLEIVENAPKAYGFSQTNQEFKEVFIHEYNDAIRKKVAVWVNHIYSHD